MIELRILTCFATFTATFVAVIFYVIALKRKWGENVLVKVDPDNPDAETIAGYFKEIAVSLDERPRKLRLVLDGRNNCKKTISLDLATTKSMAVLVGDDKKMFSLRNRWIAEHPVPLKFSSKPRVLFVKPVDSNRFRVMTKYPFRMPQNLFPILCLIAVIGVFTVSFELVVLAMTILCVGKAFSFDKG